MYNVHNVEKLIIIIMSRISYAPNQNFYTDKQRKIQANFARYFWGGGGGGGLHSTVNIGS